MSDERLRDLERRWQGTRSPETERALIEELRRTGRITADALEAAACLGHPNAKSLLGGTPPGTDDLEFWWLGSTLTPDGPRWSRAVERLGDCAVLRVAIAVARSHLPALSPSDQPIARELLEIAERTALGEATLDPTSVAITLCDRGEGSASFARMLFPGYVPFTTEVDRKPHRRLWDNTQPIDRVRRDLLLEVAPWLLSLSDPLRERRLASHAPEKPQD